MPPSTASLQAAFDALKGHPSGDLDDWRARYAPFFGEVVVRATRPHARVSVVVVAHQHSSAHEACMRRIRENTGLAPGDIELIVVDNSALPKGLPIGQWADVHLKLAFNTQCTTGRNIGAIWASAPLLCFLDDDGLIAYDYFERALDYFDQDPKLAALRTRILPRSHPYFTAMAGHYDRGPEVIEECLSTEGSSVIRRALYVEVGGFPDATVGHEGIDLTYCIKRHDPTLRVIYAPDIVMHHDYMDSWDKFVRKSLAYANIDAPQTAREPELQRFMDDYFARRFSTSQRPLDVRVVARALNLSRKALKLAATLRTKRSSR